MQRLFSALKHNLLTLLQHRFTLYEWAAITGIGLLYIGLLFSYQTRPGQPRMDINLTGLEEENRIINIEHERLSGILIPVAIGLEEYGQIPTWNPYLSTGKPLINNAFSYLFNPFASLPFLGMGAVQGGKVALMINLLISGYNAWALAKVIGLGAAGRVTTAALYMMSGGIIAKFHVGHFQLGLSLAWVPLVFAGLWWTLKSEDRRAPVLMAVAFALLFFSGNIYYSLHTLISCAAITAMHSFSREAGRWRLRWDRLRRVMIGGLLGLGLTALFFLPVWSVRAFVSHPGDPELVTRYPLFRAISNFIFPYEAWQEFENPYIGLMVVVDYAYIGPMVFLLIALMGVVSLFQRQRGRHQRSALIALGLALIMMIWGAGQSGLLQKLYADIPLLAQFRYVGRAHSIAALWWIVLAGISLDVLWQAAQEWLLPSAMPQRERRYLWAAALMGGLLWLWSLLYSLSDNLTRLSLALRDLRVYRLLNELRFLHLTEGINQFWYLLLVMMGLSVGARLIWGALRHLFGGNNPLWLRRGLVSGLRLGVVVLAFAALADVIQVNGRLLHTDTPIMNTHRLYSTLFQHDRNPIPAIHESYSPAAYEAYLAEVRNWDLDEGWKPLPVYTAQLATALEDLPGWAVVSSEFVDAVFADRFVEGKNRLLQGCTVDVNMAGACDIAARPGAALYQLLDALPYAFIVEEQRLFADSAITPADTFPVQVISHRQDTISIRATMPEAAGPYMLIVRETHFPGWQVNVDNVPTVSQSIGVAIGIPLSPGTQTYTLRYQPPGFAGGLLISLITLAVMGFYLRGLIKKAAPVNETAFESDLA